MSCHYLQHCWHVFKTLRPRQNGSHFADDTFNSMFVNENVRISIKFSLKFVPKGLINNIPSLVQIMAWHRWGDKPLSEPMMVRLLTHICVTRPQWVNWTTRKKPWWNWNLNPTIFIIGNTFENVISKMDQWWLDYWRIYASLGLNELTGPLGRNPGEIGI